MKIGIYGGTFDPIHDGHIYCAEEAIDILKLDKLVFVPNFSSPLKKEANFFSKEKRLELINNKIINCEKMSVDTIQINNPEKSYTIDLVKHYLDIVDYNTELFYIMGSDSLLEFNKYKGWEETLKLVKLFVIQRPQFNGYKFLDKYPTYKNRIKIYTDIMGGNNMSSTKIRRKLKGRNKWKQ